MQIVAWQFWCHSVQYDELASRGMLFTVVKTLKIAFFMTCQLDSRQSCSYCKYCMYHILFLCVFIFSNCIKKNYQKLKIYVKCASQFPRTQRYSVYNHIGARTGKHFCFSFSRLLLMCRSNVGKITFNLQYNLFELIIHCV